MRAISAKTIFFSPVLLLLSMFFFISTGATRAGELIQPSHLEYRGAFRLPAGGDGYGWEWGGHALTYYPAGDPNGPADGYPGSLFGTGHDWYQKVSEFSIPVPVISENKNINDLNTASTLQPFTDIRSLLFGNFEMPYAGLEYLPARGAQQTGKLYFCWHQHLQISPHEPTHGWCELDLSSPQAAGPWYLGNYDTYSTTDYLFSLPDSWAGSHVGGKRLASGRMRDGGQGGQGPCIFVSAPWQEGNPPPANATLETVPLLLYSTSYWDDPHGGIYTMDRYHHSDMWPGAAWLTAGNRSAAIFVGTKGRGDCWYGNQDGPCLNCENRGWWSSYFDGEIIFYDPDELAAVAGGTMEPYQPQPYAVMNIDDVLYHIDSPQMYDHVKACAFDRVHGFLYVFEPLADNYRPLVHVWKVHEDAGETTPTPKPSRTATVPTPTPATPPANTPPPASTPTPAPSSSPGQGCDCGPLPTPGADETVVVVGSVTAIQNEIDTASGKKTIYLRNGTYPVSGTGIEVTLPDITIRSLSGKRDGVIIQGEGMGAGGEGYGIRIGASRFTLADLTIRDVQNHGVFIHPDGSPSDFLFHNIRIVDCGEQLFKASGESYEGTKDNGVIRCSTFEYTTSLDEGAYTNGIDLLHSNNWVISDCVLRNIKAAPGANDLAGPAILVWKDSSGTIVERNRVIDCDMGISFGNSYDTAPSHSGGIIRNNFIKGYSGSDFGICISKSPQARVINNTVYCPGAWPYSIEIQHSSSTDCLIMNNLADEDFFPDRFGANNPVMTTNYTGAQSDYFAAPGSGDLHLVSVNLPVVDAGTLTSWRTSDIDCGTVSDGMPDIGADEYGTAPIPTPTPAPERERYIFDSGDYDGDGRDDIALFRPGSGLWAIRQLTHVYFGTEGDIPVPGDYNGDGITEIGIFRPQSGLWAIRGFTRVYFGSSADRPAPGDYNGDGTCDLAVFRADSGLWVIRNITRVYFGAGGDEPVPGDYDGEGALEIAIFRENIGLWALRNLSRVYFGLSGDQPVPGNWGGNGSWDYGIFRAEAGLWAIPEVTRTYFGRSGDETVVADYDGDGVDEIGIFRESSGLWVIRQLSRAYFGKSGDVPVSR